MNASNLLKFLAKPALWVIRHIAGQNAADSAAVAIAESALQREIEANKPAITAAIGAGTAGLQSSTTNAIELARTRIVAQVDKLKLSPEAQARIVGAITAASIPAETQADQTIAAFATAVAGEVAKL